MCTAEWVDAFGSLLGGVAAFAAAAFAILRGPAELHRWRDERRDTKRAEIAGGAIVAALQFIEGLRRIASPVSSPSKASEPTRAGDSESRRGARGLERELKDRWAAFEPIESEFKVARRFAAAWLPDDAVDVLDRLAKYAHDLWAAQQMHLGEVQRNDPGERRFYDKALGSGVWDRLDAFSQEVRTCLRPYAAFSRARIS